MKTSHESFQQQISTQLRKWNIDVTGDSELETLLTSPASVTSVCDITLGTAKQGLDKATCSSSKVSKPLAESCQQTLLVMLGNKRVVDESVARASYSAGIPFV